MCVSQVITERLLPVSLLLFGVFVQACSTETTPTAPIEPQPTSGSLEVTIEETGPRPDTDGYDVAITFTTQVGPVVRPVQQGGGSLLLADLPLGTHVLRVEGLAAHCWVTERHPRAFTIEAGKTTQVVVGISCPGPGAVLVKTVTRGRDVGGPAYTVSIQGESAQERSIGTNDSLLIGEEDLPAGMKWFVQLSSVPDNCWVDKPPEEVRQLRGATVRIEYAVVCIPSNSRIAFELGGGIYLTSGSEAVALSIFNGSPNRGPSLSPGRSRVVFSTTGADAGGNDLFIVDTDGSGGNWVTTDGQGAFVGSQAWSPDGSRIVFWKTTDGEIYVVNADGSGEVRLTFSDTWNTSPAWSPDGTKIAFCRTVGDPLEGSPDVYRMSAVDGSGLTRLAESGCDPAWSPDGSKIAFTDFDLFAPASALAVIDADGSGLTRLHPINTTPLQRTGSPSWSPDGTLIAYVGGAHSNRIWIVEFDGSAFGETFPYRFGTAPSWR
jgi:Tol biopolymer transport system component